LGTSPCSSSSSGVAIVVDITGQYVSASNDTLSVAVYENGTQIATVTPTSFAPILLPVTS
jgi:archaellum component FlaF (FlaF/FlaG flagellin family)